MHSMYALSHPHPGMIRRKEMVSFKNDLGGYEAFTMQCYRITLSISFFTCLMIKLIVSGIGKWKN